MGKRNKKKQPIKEAGKRASPAGPHSPQIELHLLKTFEKDLHGAGEAIKKEVRATLQALMTENQFTPGMNLRTLDGFRKHKIKYFKAGADIRITVTIEYKRGVQHVYLRRIRKHDNLSRNP